jgi:hypothetical protein
MLYREGLLAQMLAFAALAARFQHHDKFVRCCTSNWQSRP